MNRITGKAAALVALCCAAAACDNREGDHPPGLAMLADVTVGSQIGPRPGPGAAAAAIRNPFEDDPAARAEGQRLFNWYNCSGCHGSHAGGGMGPSLRDSTWLYGNQPDDIFNSIAEGRGNGMPAWGTKVPGEQIWKVVGYIRTLGTSGEISPPPPLPAEPPPVPTAARIAGSR